MKRLPKLVLILVLLGAGIALWFLYRSPAYALWELNKALSEKNLAVFYKRVDLEGLYRSSIDALATKKLADAKEQADFLDNAGLQLGAGLDKISAGWNLDLVKHELELELLRDRRKIEPLRPNLEKTLFRRFWHDARAVEFSSWVYVEDGALVQTKIDLLAMQKSYALPLRMKRNAAGDWQLSSFEGLSSLLSVYEKDRDQKLKDSNAKLEGMLRENLPFFGETRRESSSVGLGSALNLDLLFENKFAEAVTFIKGEIQSPADDPKLKVSFESGPLEIKPKEKKVFLVKKEQYLSPVDTKLDGLSLSFRYEEVHLESGKILKVASDFDDISF